MHRKEHDELLAMENKGSEFLWKFRNRVITHYLNIFDKLEIVLQQSDTDRKKS